MRIGPVRALVSSRAFPAVPRGLLLLGFGLLIGVTWQVTAPAGVGAKLFAKANAGTLLIWGLWWPAMIWLAVGFGRVWCAVCPLELWSGFWRRGAAVAGIAGRALPRGLAQGGLVVALYAGVQLLVFGVQLHRVPAFTAWLLLALLLLAAMSGAVFRHRAFCRGFCPVGLLLGTYGRGGVLAVRPSEVPPPVRPATRDCATLLNPATLDSNAQCLMCAECVKARPGAMQLLLQPPFAAADHRPPLAPVAVTVFVMLLSGFVTAELFTEWPEGNRWFLFLPERLGALLAVTSAKGWIQGFWGLAFVPAALWFALFGFARLGGNRATPGTVWRQLALPLAVIVAAGHMSKGLAKFVSWGPYLPGAWQDPAGTTVAAQIARRAVAAPEPWLPIEFVAGIGVVLIVSAYGFALREYRLAQRQTAIAAEAALPLGAFALAAVAVVACWGVA
jgi:hypothetical protein